VVCLIGICRDDTTVRRRKSIVGDYSDEQYRRQAHRTLASIKNGIPDGGKK
jgi:hypothetical protein